MTDIVGLESRGQKQSESTGEGSATILRFDRKDVTFEGYPRAGRTSENDALQVVIFDGAGKVIGLLIMRRGQWVELKMAGDSVFAPKP